MSFLDRAQFVPLPLQVIPTCLYDITHSQENSRFCTSFLLTLNLPPPKKCICKNANDCKRDNFLLSMRYSYNSSKKFIQFSFSGNVIMSRSQNRNSREGFTTFSLQKVITTQFAKKELHFSDTHFKSQKCFKQRKVYYSREKMCTL